MDTLLANYPSLYSHKGTPVRFVLELTNSDRLVVEPLRYNAAALVLKADVANPLLPTDLVEDNVFALVGHDGQARKIFDPNGAGVKSIEAFVIYPNGATWSGYIFQEQAANIGMLVWSWELGRHLKLPAAVSALGLNLSWPEVPTTIAILKEEILGMCGCRFVHHSCPDDCSGRSKIF